jgi:hypothetical protein
MPLKTFLATVEVRIVVDVPEDFSTDDLNNSLEMYPTSKGTKVICGEHGIEDIEVIDVSSDEHTDEMLNANPLTSPKPQ